MEELSLLEGTRILGDLMGRASSTHDFSAISSRNYVNANIRQDGLEGQIHARMGLRARRRGLDSVTEMLGKTTDLAASREVPPEARSTRGNQKGSQLG